MFVRLARNFSFAVTLVLATSALAQTPDIPDAPKPKAPDFTLPATAPHILVQSSGPPPPAPEKDSFCSAPSATGFHSGTTLTIEQKAELKEFVSPLSFRIYTEWMRGIPRAAKDPWLKGGAVLIKFDVRHNGSLADTTIMMSSGRGSYDEHVLQAVKDAAPYPLPDDIAGPISFCIYFTYNVQPKDKIVTDPFGDQIPQKTSPPATAPSSSRPATNQP